MNKKYIMAGITCGFILISGICYSITFTGCGSKSVVSSSLSQEDSKIEPDSTNSEENAAKTLKAVAVSHTPSVTGEAVSQPDMIYCHICGAVKKPGVYKIKSGERIFELIKLSGGLKKEAAGDYINQAGIVADGQKIYIPTLKEVKDLPAGEFQTGEQSTSTDTGNNSRLININTAQLEELMTLPGIGQSKAESIIEYRTTNGNFKAIEDLMNISGIKEGVYNHISSLITVK